MDQQGNHSFRPTIYRVDSAKLPAALQPLCARPQWVVWRLTWRHGRWTKPPFRCDDRRRFASSSDSDSWSSYENAVAAAADADGITYVLTPEDSFAAIDIDHVRDPVTGTIKNWAQRFLDKASHTYAEVSPSGTGLRIWGTASGESMHRISAIRRSSYSAAPGSRSPLRVCSSATSKRSATSTLCSTAPSSGPSSAITS
jgi:primase-polymerase (primpol)-like protein